MKIFDPFFALFKIDYDKRITNMLRIDLYEARKRYVAAIQNKQNADMQLAYAEARIKTLTELLNNEKELANATTVNNAISSINATLTTRT